jgi:pyruvate dehydrogenase E1 component alpha subunit
MFDAELYRSKAEVDEWKTRGPIHTFSARLKQEGKLSEEEFLAIDEQVNAEVEEAVAFAEAGTWEPIEDMLADVYTPAGSQP